MIHLVALVGLSFSSVDALNCYQCNSTTTAGCTEKFDYGSRVLQSASCQVSDAGYCVKAIGVWGGIFSLFYREFLHSSLLIKSAHFPYL